MADYTITLTPNEEKILLAFWPTVDAALAAIIERQIVVRGREVLYQSDSAIDPRKLEKADLLTEIGKATTIRKE